MKSGNLINLFIRLPEPMKIVLRFQRARSILGGNSMIRPRGAPRFAECLGLLSLNTDSALWHKFQWIEEDAWLLSWWDRAHLVELATRDVSWMGLSNLPESIAMHELQEDSRWKRLNFIHYYLNGADDVVKYEKWEWATETARYFTIGRPGWTAKVITGAQACGVWNTPYFYIAPELPDISATEVRASLRQGDRRSATFCTTCCLLVLKCSHSQKCT